MVESQKMKFRSGFVAVASFVERQALALCTSAASSIPMVHARPLTVWAANSAQTRSSPKDIEISRRHIQFRYRDFSFSLGLP